MFDHPCFGICMMVFAFVAFMLFIVVSIIAVYRESEECKAIKEAEKEKRVKEIEESLESSINREVLEELIKKSDNLVEQLEELEKATK